MTVIGKCNGTGGDHIAHLGKLLAGKPLGAGTNRIDARASRLPGALFEKILDHGARIDHGIGVGHGYDTREPAMGGSAHTGDDVFLVLLARIAEVHVHVDHAGDEVLARAILHEKLLGQSDIRADGNDETIAHEDVRYLVNPVLRIDHMGIFKQQRHCLRLQAVDT